ncbi:MAG: TonB-dependent receptor [Cyclobacteriaceae bacterium]|nr:TonB-dependent receptor [Cyclobacteriaceae bacterium]
MRVAEFFDANMFRRMHPRGWLTIAIVFVIGLFSLELSAQKKSTDAKISIDVREQSLGVVLRMISEQSGMRFSYNPKKLPVMQKITYQAKEKTITVIMSELSSLAGFRYDIVEGQMILQPAGREEKQQDQKVTLSGFLKDDRTGEALIGATVLFPQLAVGAASNAYGFYSVTVPKGKYTVQSSFVGYDAVTEEIDLTSSLARDVTLKEGPPVLQEILVTDQSSIAIDEVQTTKASLRPKTVEERPALFGEMDVLKSLESVPGVKLHSDGSTFYYVRGGQRDQNLVLIDGSPIYNPSHILGIFSTIIPDAANDITLYKGEMPASIGGRLSSVLDVQTKKGNDQRVQAWGNLGLISTKLGIEGPLTKDKSSFLLSYRVSRLKWLFQLADNNIKQFQFYDLTGKLNFKIDPRNQVYFSFYSGADNYFNKTSGISWSNAAATARWNHLFNNRLFLNTTVAGSAYSYSLFSDLATDTRWNSRISNVHLKGDFSYFIQPDNELTFGAALSGYFMDPGNFQTRTSARLPALSVRNTGESVLYVNHELKRGRWGFNYGARLTNWTNAGESFEFVFDDARQVRDTLFYKKGENYNSYVNLEPRATVQYGINENSSVRLGYARNVQNLHLITNSISPFTSLEVWLPSSINIQPQLANQITMGYYRHLANLGISFSGEVFYKKLYNQIDYTAHAETLLNPLIERELRFGSGTAYGVELLMKKETGRLRGWFGYSYARAKRRFAELNNGQEFNAFSDRPHQISCMLSYDITLRWNLAANWNFLTGAPFTSPVSFYQYNGQEVPIYGQRSNDRLPDYHRMDISSTWKLNRNLENKFQHSLTFSIYNFYGRKNALFINYNKIQTGPTDFKIPTDLIQADRVASQTYLFQFTPSLSYNFKFL